MNIMEKSDLTPKKLAEYINSELIDKPAKKVLFTTFTNNLKTFEMLINSIKYSNLTFDDYKILADKIQEKMNLMKEEKIKLLEEQLKKLKEL